ncbi:hypothetical protein B0F90DRAFT_1681425 [Multifurca ochricompacta]|uniref:RING-type domain-containing protein n=1 Tax=Multifurca ochricompacta TaxID=376703 RepID=A0AAD4MGZ5_9AGAM|nr:hypothetical protein B0F90DRAFT_1681425 [Multifurca ochricompacta]
MSSREQMWYCHECHAEMRPLMVPDPHCASCNGTFVEKIESEADDPRNFRNSGPPFDDGTTFGGGPGLENVFMGLSQFMNGPRSQHRSSNGSPSPDRAGTGGTGFRLEINRGPGGSRTIVLGSPPTLGGNRRGAPGEERQSIGGSLMAQYLLAMLTQRAGRDGHGDPFSGFSFLGGPEDGRLGDYVFNQEALDQIITQIMEQGNSSRPVPATEDVMQKLQRDVLEEGSALLEQDCAVCKEQFALNTEDPDDQVIVTLPCKHPFHEGCIMPWLKSSGTCPVCRFQLVPQPEHRPPDGAASGSGGSPPANRGTRPDPRSGGMFGQLFNIMGGSGNNGNGSRSNRNPPPHEEWEHDEVPGGWLD